MEWAKKKLKEKDTQDVMDHIFQNALGIPIVKTTIPTNDTIKVGEIILVGDNMYIKFPNGTTKRFSGTDIS